MPDWNPALYSRFEDERTRPAADLLARVPLEAPTRVFDLGCGPGNSTELLKARYPGADVVGADNSPAMLQAARERLPGVRFELSDISGWRPDGPVDLVYANASLQWILDHERVMPRLFTTVARGGVLAIQMPDNFDEPSHCLMEQIGAEPRFAAHVGNASKKRAQILSPAAYYDLLVPEAVDVDVWRTTYHHRMSSPADIVQWLRGTGLKPYVEALPDELQPEFLSAFEEGVAQAYPARADGSRLFAFPRLFIVAQHR